MSLHGFASGGAWLKEKQQRRETSSNSAGKENEQEKKEWHAKREGFNK